MSFAEDNQGSTILMEVQLPIVNLEKCKQIMNKNSEDVNDNNICAGGELKGGRDACQV